MRRVLGSRSLAGIPLASISLLLLAGCVGDEGEPVAPDPPELLHEYETEHLRIHSDVERCEGDLARWDGFVGFAQDYLGVEAPGIVDVYVWDDAAFDDVHWCGRPMLGGSKCRLHTLSNGRGHHSDLDNRVPREELVNKKLGLPFLLHRTPILLAHDVPWHLGQLPQVVEVQGVRKFGMAICKGHARPRLTAR